MAKEYTPENEPWKRDTEPESYNDAANPPNNPKKDKQPTHFNVNYDYCDHDSNDKDEY